MCRLQLISTQIMKTNITRRHFLETSSLAGAGLSLGFANASRGADSSSAAAASKPALLGGKPACSGSFPGWPVFDQTEERALLDTLHSGQWYRGSGTSVSRVEEAYARLNGAKHCLATSSGNVSLSTVLGVHEIGPGVEVNLALSTFVST